MECRFDDVLAAFQQMSFIEGLKPSKREVYSSYAVQLQERAGHARRVLCDLNAEFAQIHLVSWMCLVLDESVVARKEFVVACRSNKCVGAVGSAHLTTFVAMKSFLEKLSPQQNQGIRDKKCTQNAKAEEYDVMFGKEQVLLYWGFEDTMFPSTRQKADMIDALIGMLFLLGNFTLANWVCERLVNKE